MRDPDGGAGFGPPLLVSLRGRPAAPPKFLVRYPPLGSMVARDAAVPIELAYLRERARTDAGEPAPRDPRFQPRLPAARSLARAGGLAPVAPLSLRTRRRRDRSISHGFVSLLPGQQRGS
jgi:hypothetical protein